MNDCSRRLIGRAAHGVFLLLIACAGTETGPAREVLRVAISRPIKGWDLARAIEFEEENAHSLVFEGLTLTAPDGRLLPGLAERWTTSDGRVFEFHLRRGVRFHDGTPFGANDVVRAWKAALRWPEASRPWPLDPIAGAREFTAGRATDVSGLSAPNDSTLVVELQSAFSAFPATLARRIVAVAAPASSDARPIGTGPWALVRADTASGYRFARNQSYWGVHPKVDSLWLRIVPESQLAKEFDAGALDCAQDVGYRVRRSLLGRTDLNTTHSPPVGLRQLVFNFRNPELRDIRVRRAMQLAIDVPRLARETGNADVVPAAGVIPPGYPGFDSTLTPWPYDPSEARRLLAEVGYRPSRPFRLWTTTSSQRDSLRSVSYRIRDYLVAVGIQVEMYISDGDWSIMTDGTVDLNSVTIFPRFPDGDDLLFPQFHSSMQSATGNEGAFSDPVVDRLLEQGRAAVDSTARTALLQKTNRLLHDRAPLLGVWFTPITNVFANRISGCPAGVFPTTFSEVEIVGARRGKGTTL